MNRAQVGIVMPKTTKTLEYRRVRWFSKIDRTAEDLTRDAWERFPTQTERTVIRRNGASISGLKAQNAPNGSFMIHCGNYTDRQAIGVLPMDPTDQVDVGERSPDDNENFLSSDFMALIYGDHVVTLSAGRNASTLKEFLRGLFEKAEFDETAKQFDLVRAANVEKLAMIESAGVQKLDLKLDISEASSAELVDQSSGVGFFASIKRGMVDQFLVITSKDETIQQLRGAQKSSFSVSINVKHGDLESVKDGIDNLAEAIIEDEEADNFVIELRTGERIHPEEVTVRKRVRLEMHANSVSAHDAWQSLGDYIAELENIGYLRA